MSLIHYLFYVCCEFNIVIAAQLKNSPAVAFILIAGGPISGTGTSRGGLIHPSTYLGLSELQARVEHYFHRGLPSTTHLTALLGDENTILLFITDLSKILVVAQQINCINLVCHN